MANVKCHKCRKQIGKERHHSIYGGPYVRPKNGFPIHLCQKCYPKGLPRRLPPVERIMYEITARLESNQEPCEGSYLNEYDLAMIREVITEELKLAAAKGKSSRPHPG